MFRCLGLRAIGIASVWLSLRHSLDRSIGLTRRRRWTYGEPKSSPRGWLGRAVPLRSKGEECTLLEYWVGIGFTTVFGTVMIRDTDRELHESSVNIVITIS